MGRISRTSIDLNKGNNVLELNEGNVDKIFSRCLAKDDTKQTKPCIIFPVHSGYSKNEAKTVLFDKKILDENFDNIRFMYGQLGKVHTLTATEKLTYSDFIMTYSGSIWTRDSETLLKLWYLGVASEPHLVEPFFAKDNTTKLSPNNIPTLSPNDPNFKTWFEGYEAKVKKKVLGGQEPADD